MIVLQLGMPSLHHIFVQLEDGDEEDKLDVNLPMTKTRAIAMYELIQSICVTTMFQHGNPAGVARELETVADALERGGLPHKRPGASQAGCLVSESTQLLHKLGVLRYLTDPKVIMHVCGPNYLPALQKEKDKMQARANAKCEIAQEERKAATLRRKAAQEERKAAKVIADRRIQLRLPPPDYLDSSGTLVVPGDDSIALLSERAAALGYAAVGPDGAEPDLASAIQSTIRANWERQIGPDRAMTVRSCLRMVGDAMVHVYGMSNQNPRPLVSGMEGLLLPAVDAGVGSAREHLLDEVLGEILTPGGHKQFRGGVVTGFKGFGKSQLLLNAALGVALVDDVARKDGWRERFVSVYVPDIESGMGKMRQAPPTMLIAAGLDRKGMLRAPGQPPPDWAVGRNVKVVQKMISWLRERRITVLLTVDECYLRAEPDENTMHRDVFVDGLRQLSIQSDSVSSFVTGTMSDVARDIYSEDGGGVRRPQSDKFPIRELDFKYESPEVFLMALRQLDPVGPESLVAMNAPGGAATTVEVASLRHKHVTAADAVLALALELYTILKYQDSVHGPRSNLDGTVVYPSFEVCVDVLKGIKAPEDVSISPAPLTADQVVAAFESDAELLEAATTSRDLLLESLKRSGMLARCLAQLRSGQGANELMLRFIRSVNADDGLFSELSRAMVVALLRSGIAHVRYLAADPTSRLPDLYLEDVYELDKEILQVAPSDQDSSPPLSSLEDMKKHLVQWSDEQIIAYLDEWAGVRNIHDKPCSHGTVRFPSILHAELAVVAAVAHDLHLTRRERDSLLLQTGEYGRDFELVVAESLHRNFEPKVLQKGLLPSFSTSLDSPLRYDREEGMDKPDTHLRLSQSKREKNQRPVQSYTILREVPDKYGCDLVFVIDASRGNGGTAVGGPPGHGSRGPVDVVRVRVEDGDSILEASGLRTFMCKASQAEARTLYEAALGLDEDSKGDLKMHRLLVTTRDVSVLSQELEEIREGKLRMIKVTGDEEFVPDASDLGVVAGPDFDELLFADARLHRARFKAMVLGGNHVQEAEALEAQLGHLVNLRDRQIPAGSAMNESVPAAVVRHRVERVR